MDAVSYSLASKQAQRIEKFIENPDSNSGVLTQPKVIEAGETVTIKSGRQAILADTVIDGNLVIEAGGDVFVPAGAGFGDLESQIALKADTSYVNGKYSGFKNYIINGGFDIWQRGTSQTTNGYGSSDRWVNFNTGSTKTTSMQITNKTEPFNSIKFCRNVVSSVAGAGNAVGIQQRIEWVNTLHNKTCTLSFYAKADTTKNIAIDFVQYFGTGGTPSAIIEGISATKIQITSSWAKYTITASIPSIAGKVEGTDGNSSFWVRFWFDAGSDFNSKTASLGQQSGTFDIAQVQLEEGSVATPFEQRPYGLEFSLCQRYARNVTVGAQASLTVNCISIEQMRSTPTITLINYSGGTGATYATSFNNNFIHQNAPHTINALAFLLLTSEL